MSRTKRWYNSEQAKKLHKYYYHIPYHPYKVLCMGRCKYYRKLTAKERDWKYIRKRYKRKIEHLIRQGSFDG